MADDDIEISTDVAGVDKTIESAPVMQFPTTFPIKVMGRDTPEFHQTVATAFTKHAAPFDTLPVKRHASSGGRFISLTVTIIAQNRAQLDALYTELTASEHVLVTL